jgi:hypothetical protein
MACSECKKKKTMREEVSRVTEPFEKGVFVFVAIWGLLGLYGLVTLIGKLL